MDEDNARVPGRSGWGSDGYGGKNQIPLVQSHPGLRGHLGANFSFSWEKHL